MSEPFLGDGLIFEDWLPLGWSDGELLREPALARLNADNHQLLVAEASLDEVRAHDGLKDESPALLHELQRLEYKLNVLLRLTGEIATRGLKLPPLRRVRLAATGMEWIGHEVPDPAAAGLIELYINTTLPQPLRLPAVIAGRRLHGEEFAAEIRFTGLAAPVVDLIEKLIFRHHRRSVAGTKTTSATRN